MCHWVIGRRYRLADERRLCCGNYVGSSPLLSIFTPFAEGHPKWRAHYRPIIPGVCTYACVCIFIIYGWCNTHETTEIVFHRPSARSSLPSAITGIEQVVSAKLLGVIFSNTLKFDEHVKNILTICNQRCYLLKCLKGQGLPTAQLNIVFCAIILSRILYALPAWGGFLTVELTTKIDVFLRKAVKWGYSQKVTSLSELLHNADEKLFSKMRSSNHSIHQLLPPAKILPMELRSTHCVFALPQCNYNLYKSSFVLRNLFSDAYWSMLILPCCSVLSDGVCLSELKGLLTYLLTYLTLAWPTGTWVRLLTYLLMILALKPIVVGRPR